VTSGAGALRDGTTGGEEALDLSWRFDGLPAPLPLTYGVVGVFSAVIEMAVLDVFRPRENGPLGGTMAFRIVGDDHARHIRQCLEEFAEELLGRRFMATALDQDIEYIPFLVDGSPEIVTHTMNREKDLIDMPLASWLGTLAPELIGIPLAELHGPLANRLIGRGNRACKERFFDILIAEAETVIKPHAVADELCGKPVLVLSVGRSRDVHATVMSH
jgi:hypothetical protein